VEIDVAKRRWEQEQTFLGLARGTSVEEFARGGLAAFAAAPTVRIIVLPGDPSAQWIPAETPETVVPKVITLPFGGELPSHETVRGTSSGYVGFTTGNGGRWKSFNAVLWHGGVDVFLGTDGGWTREISPGSLRRVIFLRACVGWAWAAFDLQRQMVQRYKVAGPFRVVLGVADTAGALLANLGAGWAEPGSPGVWNLPVAIESRVLLLEDLAEWPDEKGVEELALRFGARVDLAFGGPGMRHLDHDGPEEGRFNPRW
jgi:hypothetical protein